MKDKDRKDNSELLFSIVKTILFDTQDIDCSEIDLKGWEGVFQSLQQHALVGLSNGLLRAIPDLPDEFRKRWKTAILSVYQHNVQLVNVQRSVLSELQDRKIPVVVLKGTSAACYYPKPQGRTLGDIDLLVLPEDYDRTCGELLQIGWTDISEEEERKKGRHLSFQKRGIVLELHASFATLADPENTRAFNQLLFDNITLGKTVLPDRINGLVLLEHIAQHLNKGIGMRQIIDWMMFVNSCLDDEAWDSGFREKVRYVGMEEMAIVVTRMCQLYLGLREDITWCRSADPKECKILIDYVLQCGNFGRSKTVFQSEFIREIPTFRQPIKLIKHLQEHGERSWEAQKRFPILRPFAWIYQGFRYLSTGKKNKLSLRKMKDAYDLGQERKNLFDKFGIPM